APVLVAVFWLLTQPLPDGMRQLLWPAAAGLLLPLSGLGSAACQEVFRRRAEERPAGLLGCLAAACRGGWEHAAGRGRIFIAWFFGSWLILMPGLAVLISAAAVHPILASGEENLFRAWTASGQAGQRQPGKSAAVVLCRLPLLVLATINLFMAIHIGLWSAEHLGGLDIARLPLLFSAGNPVYLAALLMLAWLLLAPYFEASNYLLHVDSRARYEGLDLWYRVQRYFPARAKVRAGVFLLGLGLAGFAGQKLSAEESRLTAIEAARKEIQS